MDFGAFRKAVANAAIAVAPTYKAGAVGVAGIFAPPAAPFLAVAPPLTLFGIGQPSLFLLPEYRRAVEAELGSDESQADYTKLGEMAATAYLQKKGV